MTIGVRVHPDGTGTLPKGSVEVDANAIVTDGEFKPLMGLLTDWHDVDQLFEDPKDIFRLGLGKERVQGRHEFSQV